MLLPAVARITYCIYNRTLVDFAPLIYANGEGTFVRACMVSPCAAFVVVVPFVQVRGVFVTRFATS